MTRSKTAAASCQSKDRQGQALALRKRGATYEQIAKSLGVSRTQAHRYVTKALRDLTEQVAEEAALLRALEGERLDALWVKVFEKARQGDLHAIDRALRIHNARVALFGLALPPTPQQSEQPQTITVKFQDDLGDDEEER